MNNRRIHIGEAPQRPRSRTVGIAVLTAFALTGLSTGADDGGLQNSYPHVPTEMVRIPDANQQNDINRDQQKKQSYDTANLERKKKIAEESALLLKLATDLKSEVDKTNKDTLSLSVIRKADAIEKLAHDVKEKMKLTVGTN